MEELMTDAQKKLNEIQQKLSVPKNNLNKFGGYKYRSAEDILEAVKKILGEAILTIDDEIVSVGERYYIKATATLSLNDSQVSTTAFAREAENKKGMDESQVTGATSSYARKYALNGLFAIDDTKDADSMDNTKPSVENKKITPAQKKKVESLVKSRGRTINEVYKIGKISSLDEVDRDRAEKLINYLSSLPEADLH